jgi:predicted nucleotidyltransferase
MATAVDSRIPEFVSRRLAEIEAVCRSHYVTRLELFGSAVTDDFDPARRDLDFVVEFDFSAENVNWLNVYFEFKESLETLFDRSVDLVSYRSVRSPRLRANIDEHRSLLYAA